VNDENRREADLRDRVEGSRRNLSLAKIPDADPPETYRELVRDYPVGLVASGLVAGLIAGALLPRGIGRKLGRGLISGALLAGEIGRNYSQTATRKAGEAGREGREKVIELSSHARAASGRTLDSTRRIGMKVVQETLKIASNLKR
jgi:hypothetical protein